MKHDTAISFGHCWWQAEGKRNYSEGKYFRFVSLTNESETSMETAHYGDDVLSRSTFSFDLKLQKENQEV